MRIATKGVDQSKYGMRRPHRPRWRSLWTLMAGAKIAVRIQARDLLSAWLAVSLAPMSFSFRLRMPGTFWSSSVKMKSPHNSQMKSMIRPNVVYLRVPQA